MASSVRLNQLINDIVELHRLESVGDGFSLDAPVALSDIEAAVVPLYGGRDDGRIVVFDADEGDVAILAEHLQSVLINLIDNAFKYSEGDRIIATIQRTGPCVEITVDDSGPLISGSDRERIFERFYTCSKSRNKHHSGTGLGLSIVKHIASLYGGTVCVAENRFGGNRFRVSLYEKLPESG